MANTHRVISTALNLRSEPKVAPATRIATLHEGQEVRKLGESTVINWWQIEAALHGVAVGGYVNSQFLGPIAAVLQTPAVAPGPGIPAVHLVRAALVARSHEGGRAHALNEPGSPRRPAGSAAAKVAALHAIVQWLEVEQSARYLPKGGKTFCNIYAYDYCYLAQAFLPRVWWMREALRKLEQGTAVTPAYGTTVSELNANSLHQWFDDYGADFGWRRVASVDDLQRSANQGAVAVISGRNADGNRPGHIVAVVPEKPAVQAQRTGGVVTRPVQSQAGASNFRYGGTVWWTSSKFSGFSFWVHD